MYSKERGTETLIVVYNTPYKCQSAIKDLVIIVTKKMWLIDCDIMCFPLFFFLKEVTGKTQKVVCVFTLQRPVYSDVPACTLQICCSRLRGSDQRIWWEKNKKYKIRHFEHTCASEPEEEDKEILPKTYHLQNGFWNLL